MTDTKVIAFSQSYTVIQNLKNLYFFLLPLHPGIKLGYLVNGC